MIFGLIEYTDEFTPTVITGPDEAAVKRAAVERMRAHIEFVGDPSPVDYPADLDEPAQVEAWLTQMWDYRPCFSLLEANDLVQV